MMMPAAVVSAPRSTQDFDAVYATAERDPRAVPWARCEPHPALVTWLNAVAPSLIRCGARVAVVGCGLGDDVRALVQRGFDVTGFDCSPCAIDWARERHPSCADSFQVGCIFDPPSRWRRRFDLVVEINTIQALPLKQRPKTMGAIAELVGKNGYLLVIARGTEAPAPADAGPPWPLTESEVADLARGAGLAIETPPVSFMDDDDPPVRRLRAVFRR
ncbi:MAG: class I SAM-dependent methyltransferase [Planctomycetota bacterium]